MSIIFLLMSIGSMSHVDFKKWPCHPVDFRGLVPSWRGREEVGGGEGGRGDTAGVSAWVYYHISNAMQYSKTALETTA